MMAKFLEAVLKARVLIVIAFIGVLCWGYHAYKDIPRDAFPDISPVMVPVFCEADGLAAEEVEEMISQPVETAMSGLPGVTLVKSTSGFGLSVVYVYFRDDIDIYFARQIVSERLDSITSQLPPQVEKPELGPISTGLGQVFIYYLDADPAKVDTQGKALDAWLRELNDFVVKRQLQTVPGVTTILSMGGHVLQYQVRLDADAMRRYDVAFSDVVEKIQVNNRNVGGQYLEIGSEEYLLRGIGRLNTLQDIAGITIKEHKGVPLKLSDIAEVKYGNDIRRGVVTLNGEREVVSGLVLKLYGENTSKVISALHKKLEDVQRGLPSGVKIVPYYDQANLVDNASSTVESALFQGMLLVVLVLALSLWNFRASLIVSLSMPFCAAVTMIVMQKLGMSANLMSLGGIAIALGMLVDGSIVVVENILRHLKLRQESGKSRLDIVREATLEVARPISFALMIIMAVFAPIFMFEGVEGKMFKPLAFTIVFSLGASIIAASVIAPVLSFVLLKKTSGTKNDGVVADKCYIPLLGAALKWRKTVFAVVLAALAVSLFTLSKIGREFMPTLEEGSIMITVNMAPSIGLGKSEQVVRTLEKLVMEHPEVSGTVTRIGRPEAGSHPHPVNFAEIHVELKQPEKGSIGAAMRKRIVDDLRHKLSDYPGVNVNFSQPIQNSFEELLSGTRAYFALKLYGENLDVLRTKAEEIRHAVEGIPGVVDLSVEQSYGQPQLQVKLKHHVMAHLGVTGEDVMELVEHAVGGVNAGMIYKDIRRYNINVRLKEKFRMTPEELGKLKVKARNGRYVRLDSVADIIITEGPVQINREKIQRRWTIQGNVSGRAPSEIVEDMRKVISEKVDLPAGYFVEFGGQFENQERAMRKLYVIVPLVIGVILLLLCITFKSFRSSMIVMINVPLALIGGVVGLWMTGQLLSVPAAVGFIALFGIAMQDAVVMVTDFRDLRASGADLYTAIIEGSRVRFKAVILTTLTTLLGLLPLLLSNGIGAEVQKPLAAIVVYGLGTSTMLTLFFLPTLYYTIEKHFDKKAKER
ncbi:MAG: efflux RND transporter permease subunit [Lentisphaerae bacterium]|nr:efflux RND transporter permease subunit [Lentisphaerota bacterium]